MCTFLLQYGALWDMGLVHCGTCEIGLLKWKEVFLNSLRHADASMCKWTGSSLDKVMVCCLFITSHYQNQGGLIVNWIHRNKFKWKLNESEKKVINYLKKKIIFQFCLHNICHFVPVSRCFHMMNGANMAILTHWPLGDLNLILKM